MKQAVGQQPGQAIHSGHCCSILLHAQALQAKGTSGENTHFHRQLSVSEAASLAHASACLSIATHCRVFLAFLLG